MVFASVTSPIAQVAPGQFSRRVRATVRNEGSAAATDVRVSLAFDGATTSHAGDFAAREVAWSAVVGSGATVAIDFDVDVLASARADEDVTLSGSVSYRIEDATFTESSAQSHLWQFTPVEELLVDTTTDVTASDGVTSLREAIAMANADAGLERIRFDPAVFPSATGATILLLSELPALEGTPLVIDGSGAGVRLEPAAATYQSGGWLLRVRSEVTVSGIRFVKSGELYPVFNLNGNSCNGGEQNGGAILAETAGAVLTVTGCSFDDTGVLRRNCYAPTIRAAADSTGPHRIVDSDFVQSAGDALVLYAPTSEVSRTRIVGARDDGIFVGNGTGPTRLVGNLIADTALAGILVSGPAGSSELLIAHGTFLRNRWGVRSFDIRPLRLVNNAFGGHTAEAHNLAGNGENARIARTHVEGSALCTGGCTSAMVDRTVVPSATLGLTNGAGNTRADALPAAGSGLIDAAIPIADVNGPLPGAWNDLAPDIGAVESD